MATGCIAMCCGPAVGGSAEEGSAEEGSRLVGWRGVGVPPERCCIAILCSVFVVEVERQFEQVFEAW